MLISIHPIDPEPRKLQRVVDLLNEGGVIVCPTDTVYGFVCSSLQPRAIEKLAELKGVRPAKAELSLIVSDLGQLSAYARALDTAVFRLLKRALPGPYTFILPASSEIPKLFKNNRRTVGIRLPDHPVPQAIVRALGHALVVASVHDTDGLLDHTADPELIHKRLGHGVAAVIDSGMCGLEASTVIDASQGPPKVLRQGKGDVEGLL
ncbi:MAG: threonylcarbamoyl-AMP synthase [Flavobacteriales bacterium]|nr:threonylcarbamoyl-AMP synthase [Flavobacteriales bacterium]